MKKFIGTAVVLYAALVLVSGSCGNGASSAKEENAAAKTGAAGGGDTASAKAWADLQRELTELHKAAATTEQQMAAIDQTVAKLNAFAAAHPGTHEAGEAKLNLAFLYSSIGSFDKAVPYLEEFIRNGDEADERVGYAHFYLAEAYKNVDRYDDAQKEYRTFVDKYSHLNPKIVATATAALGDLPSMRQLSVGNEPIPFSVKDIEGKTLTLASYKGKVVLLDFWATWCMPCKQEMPNVLRIHDRFHKKGFEIIGISLDSDRVALDRYIKSNKMTWPQYFDGRGWQNGVAEIYKVRSIPATYLIDKQGKIRYRSLRGAELERAVEMLLAES
jgi:peroxiredoxin